MSAKCWNSGQMRREGKFSGSSENEKMCVWANIVHVWPINIRSCDWRYQELPCLRALQTERDTLRPGSMLSLPSGLPLSVGSFPVLAYTEESSLEGVNLCGDQIALSSTDIYI